MEFRINVYVQRSFTLSVVQSKPFTINKIAPRPKLKYSSKCEEKDILQQTFDKLGYIEEVFLGCKFFGKDDDDNNFEFSGDSDDNGNGEMNNMKNVTSFMKIQSSYQRNKSSKI